MIEVGRQGDDLDAGALEPFRHLEGDRSGHAQAGRLRIVAGEDDHLGVLEDVVPDRVLIGLAERGVEAPDVLGAPVIAFPAVRIADLLRPPAPAEVLLDHVEEVVAPEMQRLQVAALPVAIGLDQDRLHRAVLVADAVQLLDHDVERPVPADARIAAAAAHLGIRLVRAPVVAQQRILDPGRGMDAPLGGDRQRHLDLLARTGKCAAGGGLDLVEPDIVRDMERHGPDDFRTGHMRGHREIGSGEPARRMGDVNDAVIVTFRLVAIRHGANPPACARHGRGPTGRTGLSARRRTVKGPVRRPAGSTRDGRRSGE